MKLISLNIWGGKVFAPLMEFIERAARDTDVFCFQEMFFGHEPRLTVLDARENIYEELQHALPDFIPYPRYAPEGSKFAGELPPVRIGQAIFARKDISVTESAGFYTYPDTSPVMQDYKIRLTGNFQYIRIIERRNEYIVGNIHGLWLPGTKGDTPERLEQSKILLDFYSAHPGSKHILCGDFNLHPDTQSIAMLGAGGVRNLLREYGITLTRTTLYKDMEKYNDPVADYAFVSPDVSVSAFRVLPDVVSDHSPLVVEFS